MMKVYILLLSLFAAICFIADAQLHPIQTEDLQAIVESVKKDVENHLKISTTKRRVVSPSLKDPSERQKAAVVEDIDYFIKMIQDSMHHHLVTNLGDPSESENGGSAEHPEPITEDTTTVPSTESVPDTLDPSLRSGDEDALESSSQVYEMRIGSVKGVPGVNFPNYTEIPITSFRCSDKAHIPGFYADLDAGCQVFHVCWPDRRESFLCPLGTTFNQALLVCDYWYSSNCSSSPNYYSVNVEMDSDSSRDKEETSSMIKVLREKTDSGSTSKPEFSTDGHLATTSVISFVSQFMPIKAKIAIYPETARHRPKIVASTSIGEIKKPDSKLKSRPKRTSKPSNAPVSDKQSISLTTDIPINEYKSKIFAVKFNEALDRILIDAKSDNSVSKLLWYVENTVKFLKNYLEVYTRGFSKQDSFEPGSGLYEYNLTTTKAFESLPPFVKKLLINITIFMEEIESKMKVKKLEIPHEVYKPTTSTHTPLTHLNPKFIVKPIVQKAVKLELPTPIKIQPNINTATKKALLKNYIKLFQAKRA